MMFSHNLGEVLMIFTAIAAGWSLPLLPLQILWMNLVTDVFPALALALEPASPEIMNQPPKKFTVHAIDAAVLVLIGWQSVLLAALGLSAYLWALQMYGPGAHARTVALFRSWQSNSATRSIVARERGRLSTACFAIRSLDCGVDRCAATLRSLLFAAEPDPGTVAPSLMDWIVIGSTGFLVIVVVEAGKGGIPLETGRSIFAASGNSAQ